MQKDDSGMDVLTRLSMTSFGVGYLGFCCVAGLPWLDIKLIEATTARYQLVLRESAEALAGKKRHQEAEERVCFQSRLRTMIE